MDDLGDGFALVAQIVESVDAQRLCNFMHMAIGGLVQALGQQPARAIRELEVMSAAERSQLQTWSENPQRHEGTQPVHRLKSARRSSTLKHPHWCSEKRS